MGTSGTGSNTVPDKRNRQSVASAAPLHYWEGRARRYATQGEGLAAVCSYGMPEFYNRSVKLCQRLALKPWLKIEPGTSVLDVGCGVGRWSCLMAARGAYVTGVDISPTMLAEAARRAAAQGFAQRCSFIVQDVVELDIGTRYPFILGVTVLQHILDSDRLRVAVRRLARHLATRGRMVLIEAAPSREVSRCDSPVFKARGVNTYLKLFSDCGLEVEAITGVDPMSLKTFFLPHYSRLPRPIALLALAVITGISLPVDGLLGRRWVNASWHKLFALQHAAQDACIA